MQKKILKVKCHDQKPALELDWRWGWGVDKLLLDFLKTTQVSGTFQHSWNLPVCLMASVKLVKVPDKIGFQQSKQEARRISNGLRSAFSLLANAHI